MGLIFFHVLNRTDYNKKIEFILNNTDKFKKLNKNIANLHYAKVNRLITTNNGEIESMKLFKKLLISFISVIYTEKS